MPNLDQTGPEGKGPLTGRRRGRCGKSQNDEVTKTDKAAEAKEEIIYGRGRGGRPFGGGGGQGSGRRRRRGIGNQ